jgi:hypothetical protein
VPWKETVKEEDISTTEFTSEVIDEKNVREAK